jgi:Icc-related predicted phosphoesterase
MSKTVALISDTHGSLPVIPDGVSAVLHAGDIGVDRDPVTWFRDVLYPWARRCPVPIYATFGNHDRIGERFMVPDGIPTNLRLETDALVNVLGVPVWFSPWSLRYGDWAFMAPERVLAIKYAKIPETTQVIVTHGPPWLAGDRTTSGACTGSASLGERMGQLPDLRLVVCGHIHEAFGAHDLGGVPVLNVSVVDEWYDMVHAPTVIAWPPAPIPGHAGNDTSHGE